MMVPANLQDLLLHTFHELHIHPELAFEEVRTTAHLRQVLQAHGITVLDTEVPTAVIAVIQGELPGPTVGLRADIDALPMQEETDLPYASQVPGRMHACGHDFHAAMVLGAALMLHARRSELPGRVKIIFQPAEEVDGGARLIVPTGVTDDCICFLAGHTYPGSPAGTIGVKEGPAMAAVDRFKLIIRGRGCHAAHPHKGVDPIVIQAALVQSLQTIVSRTLSPFSHSLLSITHVEAGTTWNIIPETAMLEGTIRTLDPEDRAKVEGQFRQIVSGVAAAYGAAIDVEWFHGSPAVINDDRLCALGRQVAQDCGLTLFQPENTLGGEDFSQYLMGGKPGLFVRVGTGGEYPAHHPRFTVDPDALYPAACYMTELTLRILRANDSLFQAT